MNIREKNINRIYRSLKRLYKVHPDKILTNKEGNYEHYMPSKQDIREKYIALGKNKTFKQKKAFFIEPRLYRVDKRIATAERKQFKKILEKEKSMLLESFRKEHNLKKTSSLFQQEKARIEKENEAELKGINYRGMTTRDFADYLKENIKEDYHKLVKGGMKGKDAGKEIAHMYFGS